MDTTLLIVTGLVVLVGTLLSGLDPNWRTKEQRLRTIGFGFTLIGGLLSLIMGLRSATQNETLMHNTATILKNSGETLKHVDETLGTSKDVLKDTRTNLDKTQKTLQIASTTSANVKEASSFVTGGDTYPVVFPYTVMGEHGARQIGFNIYKQGKYPLYQLSIFVNKPYRLPSDGRSFHATGTSRQLPELDDNASYPIWFQGPPEAESTFYSATMHARNGYWEEVIDVEKVSSGLAFRRVIFASSNSMVYPNKKIVDVADQNFPAAKRKLRIFPMNDLALPIEPKVLN